MTEKQQTINLDTLSIQELESLGFKLMKDREILTARIANLNQAILEVDSTIVKAQEKLANEAKTVENDNGERNSDTANE